MNDYKGYLCPFWPSCCEFKIFCFIQSTYGAVKWGNMAMQSDTVFWIQNITVAVVWIFAPNKMN